MRLLPLLMLAIGACTTAPRATPSPTDAASPRPADQCAIAGDVSRDDVSRARRACTQARERFTRILGDAPPGTITLSGSGGFSGYTEAGRWALTWPTSARMAAGAGPTPTPSSRKFVDEQWIEVLPHEIGHVMLGAWLYSPGRVLTGDYGTYMPDWIDEAVAISMEPDSIRAGRLEQARTFALPALGEVLAFRHPLRGNPNEAFSTRVTSSPPCDGPCDRERPTDTRTITERVFRDGRVTVDTAYAAGEQRLDADPLARFYILSYAVWAYVEDRGGRDAIALLMSRLRRNPRDPAALVGLPGLPSTSTAIDAGWRAWLATPAAR